MQLPAVQEGQAKPEAVLLRQQHGSWERTRRAPRPHPDGGDAHRAMLPDHARSSPQGQLGCGGHVVNVAQDITTFAATLPRLAADVPIIIIRRGAGTRPAQGPTRAEGSRATGIDMAYCKQPLLCLLYTSDAADE